MTEHEPIQMPRPTPERPVIVVGAGMAGLTAAVALHDAGVPVQLLEASDGVGGRTRTDRHPAGFLLDRGFQVLLEAYPFVRRWIDLGALAPASFDAAALIWTGRRLAPLADPRRHPGALPRDLTSPVFGVADKVRLARLALHAQRAPWQSAREAATVAPDQSAAEALWSAGCSSAFVERFARPFWGGITLDPSLESSAGPLWFTLKMLLAGRALLPGAGIGAMPEQLARRLPPATVALGARVERVIVEAGRAMGVAVDGQVQPATAVIVATDPPAARALTGIEALPDHRDGVGSLTVFLAGRRDPGIGPRLVLDGTGRLTLNHLAPLSTVQPAYAPPGSHLLAAVIVGTRLAEGDDAVLALRARDDVAVLLGHAPGDWEIVRTVRVPFSQFAQPPGIYARLPGNKTAIGGLYLAGEATVDSSYNGAIASGEAAARFVQNAVAAR
jgi:phytoene dehydrogenase-like protein